MRCATAGRRKENVDVMFTFGRRLFTEGGRIITGFKGGNDMESIKVRRGLRWYFEGEQYLGTVAFIASDRRWRVRSATGQIVGRYDSIGDAVAAVSDAIRIRPAETFSTAGHRIA